MKRKVLIFLLACTLVLAAAVPGAYGASAIDPGQGLTLTITTANLTEPDYKQDLESIEGIGVKLYQVASVSTYGEYASIAPFALGDLANEELNAQKWEEKAQAAASLITEDMVPIEATTLAKTEDGRLSTGAISIAEPGMYLVVVEEAKGQIYAFTFDTYIVAVPGNAYYTQEPAGEDAWVYDVTAGLKPQVERMDGRLEIVKTLDAYATITGTVSFVFQIEGKEPGEDAVVYSNVVAMSFSDCGSKSVTLEIPVGLEVTVTEVYSGGSYTTVSDATQTTTIVADQMKNDDHATVSFRNTNDEKLIPGNGIVNEFSKAGDWNSVDQTDNHTAVGGTASAG